VTGPTGSGKTTTLHSALDRIRSTGINVVTVDDPVEYHIAGVNQIQVNEKQGFTFATALRSVLRQDPDVVLLGEIRDEMGAEDYIAKPIQPASLVARTRAVLRRAGTP